jgi:LAO/AO transport system kinase
MTLLAAAGYSIILMETVGVGQSEHLARQFTDGFVLVLQPGGGDELQGIKRGITELADIIVVNKADGAMEEMAKSVKNQYQNAIHYFSSLRANWQPKLVTCSAITGTGIDDFWDLLRLYHENLSKDASWAEERNRQKLFWLSWSLGLTANHLLTHHPIVKAKLDEVNQSPGKDISFFQHAYQIEEIMKSLVLDSK